MSAPKVGKWITLVEWDDRLVRVKISGGVGIETFIRSGQGWHVNRVALREEELKEIFSLMQQDDIDKPPEQQPTPSGEALEKPRLVRSDELKEVLEKREIPDQRSERDEVD